MIYLKKFQILKFLFLLGNHDPYKKGSYYYDFKFEPNVYIFKGDFEWVQTDDANIYGMGFNSFYSKSADLSKIENKNNGKLNILVMHASLTGGNQENQEYNPILESKLEELNMDYITLGHIHKPYYNEKKNQRIVYPGSLVSLGFDELGEHGMIVRRVRKRENKFRIYKIRRNRIHRN